METSLYQLTVKKVNRTGIAEMMDSLAVEEPLEIQISFFDGLKDVSKTISVTMRTPGHDEDLAIGFLFTEGIIQKKEQIKNISNAIDSTNKVEVALIKDFIPNLLSTERNFYTSSSCGVCGKTSIKAVRTVSAFPSSKDCLEIYASIFFALQNELEKQQAIFTKTGGLHASALFYFDGSFIFLREDVGRHNALDKVVGAALQKDMLPLNNAILLLSGRASFELIQKATMAGIKIVAAIGAPSSLAVQLAVDSGITLIGFLKNEKFNIYSGGQRIKL